MNSQSASRSHGKGIPCTPAMGTEFSITRDVVAARPAIASTHDEMLFLDDMKGQLMRGDAASGARLNPGSPFAEITEGLLDTLLEAGTAPQPHATEGGILPEKPRTPKCELPVEVLESTPARPTGTTVSIGDRPLIMKKEMKKEGSEVPKVISKPKAVDLPPKSGQTDQAPASDRKRTQPEHPSISFSDVDDLVTTASQKKLQESPLIEGKGARGSLEKKAQKASPLPRMPVEELITATEMSLLHKGPVDVVGQPQSSVLTGRLASDVANSPLSEEFRSSIASLTEVGPTKAALEVKQDISEQSVKPLVLQRKVDELAMQADTNSPQFAENKSAKVPPASLDLRIGKKAHQPHDASMNLPEPASDQKSGSDNQVQKTFQPARPNAEHEDSFESRRKPDQTSRTLEERPKPGVNASSHLPRSSTNASSRPSGTKESQSKDTRQPMRTESHVQGRTKERPSTKSDRPEPNLPTRYLPKNVTSERHQSTPLAPGSPSQSAKKGSETEYSKGGQKTAMLRSDDARSGATMKPTKGGPRKTVPVDDGTEKHVSRLRLPRPSSASQRAIERSLSPVKREGPRPRPASAASATESSKIRGSLAKPAEERVTTTFRRSYAVTHARVSQRPGSEQGSTNPRRGAPERPRPQAIKAKSDIFEERASSRGWVSCINPNRSVLRQIPAAQMKSSRDLAASGPRSNRTLPSIRNTAECLSTPSEGVPRQ